MNEVFIHVGLHRTGTTFLQSKIFPKLTGVNFMHIPLRDIECIRVSDGKTLISHETLSVTPYNNKYHKNLTPEDRFKVADKLKTMFPKAKIIIATRDKEDWKKSLFYTYRVIASIGYTEFCNTIDFSKWTDFETYVDYLKKTFVDVFHYRYEDFKDNPYVVVDNMCKFIGVATPVFENEIINATPLTFQELLNEKKINPAFVVNTR